jgi:8-oxo-dGTP diphosphatase
MKFLDRRTVMQPNSGSHRLCFRVVAALIERDGSFLITQRAAWARLPLMWEFPGGKVEPGESDAEALARELRERLGILTDVGRLSLHVTHGYSGYDLDLLVYRCTIREGEPKAVRVQDLRWVPPEEFHNFRFPGADQKTVEALLEE